LLTPVPRIRGFTLVEIIVALTVALVVAAAIYSVVLTSQRMSAAQAERAGLQANVRNAAWIASGELRELASLPGGTAAQNDVLTAAAAGVTYRGMRSIGFLCQSPATPSELRLWSSSYSGYRDPAPGRDSALVFLEGDTASAADDAWLPVAINSVSLGSVCPGASITLATDSHPELVGLATNTPVRIYEIMELRLYQSGGKSWLGAHSLSGAEVIQPLLGPLVDGTGFTLDYLDGAGGFTTDPGAIQSVVIGVRATTESPIPVGAGSGLRGWVRDSLVARVALRNATVP
jgi:prepilin-type N-terminal cleavage/methylation domain-containing protein